MTWKEPENLMINKICMAQDDKPRIYKPRGFSLDKYIQKPLFWLFGDVNIITATYILSDCRNPASYLKSNSEIALPIPPLFFSWPYPQSLVTIILISIYVGSIRFDIWVKSCVVVFLCLNLYKYVFYTCGRKWWYYIPLYVNNIRLSK